MDNGGRNMDSSQNSEDQAAFVTVVIFGRNGAGENHSGFFSHPSHDVSLLDARGIIHIDYLH